MNPLRRQRTNNIALVLVTLCGGLVAQQAARELPPEKRPLFEPPAGARAVKDVEFARIGARLLKLDLTLPAPDAKAQAAGRKPPLLVYIHGGAWLEGGKNGAPLMWLVGEGYAVASIEYRLSREAKFPAQLHDCKGAIRWLRAHAADFGYDASRIGVAGISAGGHLVALLGTTGDVSDLEGDVGGNLDQSSRVQAVVDFFGPTDFTKLVEQGHREFTTSAAALLLGEPLSTSTRLAKLVSPVHHVTPDDAPTLILQGDRDPVVKLAQSTGFDASLSAAGVVSELVVLPCPGHGGPEFLDEARRKLIGAFFDKWVRTQR